MGGSQIPSSEEFFMDQIDESKDVQNDPLLFDPNSSSGGVFSTWTPEFVTVLDTTWGGFTGSLRVAYSWETTIPKFRVRSLAYKIVSPTWEHGNKANLSFSIQSQTGSTYKSGDDLSQDGQWRTYETPLEVSAKPDGSGSIYVKFTFDRQNAGDPSADKLKNVQIFQSPLIITSGQVPATAPIIRGRDATPGATVALMRPLFATPYGAGLATNTTWAVQSQNIPFGRQEIICRQTFGVFVSEYSNIVTLDLFDHATLSSPTNGAVVRGDTLRFWGGCTPGTTIVVLRADNNDELTAESTMDSDSWNQGLLFGKLIPTGNVSVRAKYRFPPITGSTDTVTFRVESFPIITPPATGTAFEQPFVISGTGGVLGAQIELLPDLGTSPVYGRGSVTQADGRWSVSVSNVPPGRKGLVAEQTSGSVRSGLGYPVAFDVRPARFVDVNVEIIDTSIKFSGTAHPGATVVITGPAGTVPPPPVMAETGPWSTTATGWPYGNYDVQIIQKVGDGASGWIESLPFTFLVENKLPDVYDVSATPDYQPIFKGKGVTGAVVQLYKPNSGDYEAPEARVSAGQWSSKASTVWGPVLDREVHIKQSVGTHQSGWYTLKVTIPPLAPGLYDPVENGLSPTFSGTCWPGAKVELLFSDDITVHTATVTGGTWTFLRAEPFAPDVAHTVFVTQTAAQQTSAKSSKTFTVYRPMLQPAITHPEAGSKVGRVVSIKGKNGMAGATMQLRDVQFGDPLGAAVELIDDGDWSIELSDLKFRLYTIDARQTLNGRPSLDSERHAFQVVLLPPQFTQPEQGGKLPRIATLKGTGMPGGWVDVFLQGVVEPLLANIPVLGNGNWEGDVTLPAGHTTLRARQTFLDEDDKLQTSENTDPRQFDVVPLPPVIETPATGEHVGRRVVVSGFGVPGDTITVALGIDTQSTVVAGNRSWSVAVNAGEAAGRRALQAKAAWEGFESEPEQIMVDLCTYQPLIEEPATGQWLTNPLVFSGKGRAGVGHVVSWYNPDLKLSAPLSVVSEQWRGESSVPLAAGGHWYRFRQDLSNDPSGVTASDWVESGRFEVMTNPLSKP